MNKEDREFAVAAVDRLDRIATAAEKLVKQQEEMMFVMKALITEVRGVRVPKMERG